MAHLNLHWPHFKGSVATCGQWPVVNILDNTGRQVWASPPPQAYKRGLHPPEWGQGSGCKLGDAPQGAFRHSFPLSFPPIHDRWGPPRGRGLSLQAPQHTPPAPSPFRLLLPITQGAAHLGIHTATPPAGRMLLWRMLLFLSLNFLLPPPALRQPSLPLVSTATPPRGGEGARGAEASY